MSEGAIPIDQPTLGPSTPGSQGPELPFQTHTQSQGHGLNKSSSSPELQTLPEAFSKAAMESVTVSGDTSWPRAPSDVKPQPQQPHIEKEKLEGSTGGDVNGLGSQSQGGEGPGVVSSQREGARMRLEFPAAAPQPGPISPSGGHRPRGHTISVSAPSSRRERRTDRDSYHSRPGPSNAEKISGLSPRYSEIYTKNHCSFCRLLLPNKWCNVSTRVSKLISLLYCFDPKWQPASEENFNYNPVLIWKIVWDGEKSEIAGFNLRYCTWKLKD